MKLRSLKVNALLNGIRQACSILFPLITFPYISRILGSEGFGKYNFSQSVTSYFILFAALGINTYAIREGAKIRNDKEKITKLCSQIFSINVLSSLVALISLVILVFASTKIGGYATLILIESTAIIMAVIGVNWINSIYEDYLYLTIRYIIIQVIALVSMFIFVKDPSDLIAYCIISVLATNGGNLVNVIYVRRYVKVKFTFRMDLKRHLKPLLILFVNSLAIIIYVNADITMLGYYANDTDVGIYSFASKIYNIIKQLINAIVVVALPRIAFILQNQESKYHEYINKLFSALNVCLLPVIAGLFCMSDTIIQIAGGDQYLAGDSSLKILSLAMLFAIYASLFTNCVLIVHQQESKCLISTFISAIVNIILNIILMPIIGMVGAAITTIIAEALNCFLQLLFSKPFFDYKKARIKESISCVVGTIGVIAVCIICNNIFESAIIRMGITIVISCLVYIFVLIIMKNKIVVESFNNLRSKCKRG